MNSASDLPGEYASGMEVADKEGKGRLHCSPSVPSIAAAMASDPAAGAQPVKQIMVKYSVGVGVGVGVTFYIMANGWRSLADAQ